eukprot:7686315-Pyramimonas_sp.AAC.1
MLTRTPGRQREIRQPDDVKAVTIHGGLMPDKRASHPPSKPLARLRGLRIAIPNRTANSTEQLT